ncbi:FMN reductase [Kaistia terrae]|jgi:FMN reductase|uniref:FMN reductase n=1 Tax=Kaistia terrae TaxID=537017 RepID=A0ABW0Q1I6_9HYPH|nr:FMN reductase [Kaistia terrae]MCX5579705.1 FMN reductase [Kaistia terrae]
MTELSIVGIAGNVTRPSRTAVLVGEILKVLEARTGANTRLIELVDAAPLVFAALTPDRLQGEAKELVRLIERADVLVVGTPVYRAAYTGALKHLLDLVHHHALTGVPVILTATGGTPMHALVIEHHLRPLFGFFKAMTVPTTIFAVESDFSDYRIVNPMITDRVEQVASEAVGALRARSLLSFDSFSSAGRLPLAVG